MYLDCKQIVERDKEELKRNILGLKKKPYLMIIQLNDDDGAYSYINSLKKDCKQLGIYCTIRKMIERSTTEDLIKVLNEYKNNPNVNGILVPMPLPSHIDLNKIKNFQLGIKDIDCLTDYSPYEKCTVNACVNLLKNITRIENSNCVIINRSQNIGLPLAENLIKLNANVTVLHSKTSYDNLSLYTNKADIIISASGTKILTKDMLNKKSIVLDVGTHLENGKIYGDIDKECADYVHILTPVPNGIGILTRTQLLKNLINSARKENK